MIATAFLGYLIAQDDLNLYITTIITTIAITIATIIIIIVTKKSNKKNNKKNNNNKYKVSFYCIIYFISLIGLNILLLYDYYLTYAIYVILENNYEK